MRVWRIAAAATALVAVWPATRSCYSAVLAASAAAAALAAAAAAMLCFLLLLRLPFLLRATLLVLPLKLLLLLIIIIIIVVAAGLRPVHLVPHPKLHHRGLVVEDVGQRHHGIACRGPPGNNHISKQQGQ